jgi:hypothetical protein
MGSQRLISILVLAATASACSASAAGAVTVKIGSPLSAFNSQYGASGTNTTAANVSLAQYGAYTSSPVNGTITQWHVTTITPGEFALRVLRPAAGGEYTGAGSAPQTVTGTGAHTFPANLPIQSGDLIGLDIPDGGAVAAENGNGSTYLRWVPALAEGSTGPVDSDFGGEILLSADVQYPDPAPGTPPKKKCKKKKRHTAAATKTAAGSTAQSAKKKKCKRHKKHR